MYTGTSSIFSIGLRFYYWDYYKHIDEVPHHRVRIENDPKYKVYQLYVNKRYSSFGAELLEYKHINIGIIAFRQIIMTKAQNYINTKLARSIKSTSSGYAPQHYGIRKGSPLEINHLLSIILYTDFTALSSAFSSSFRKISPYEILSSIKHRNSKYWWWSKLLRETVELFGDEADYMKGPFYSGLSVMLSVPGFSLRLCSPTSSSTHIEVALKFSGESGIILQLNVKGLMDYSGIRAFDCCWISRFKEEDEKYVCLFVGFIFYLFVLYFVCC